MEKTDVVIVGGGMSGLTACSYIAKAGKSVRLFEQQKTFGGLVSSFERDGFTLDGGIRSIENSGILFPMLKELGIRLDFVKSNVSLGTGTSMLWMEGKESIAKYEAFLNKEFPGNEESIKKITREIRKITGYMNVLYGIENPLFKDLKKDYRFIFRTLLPWLFKFLLTIRNIERLNTPVEDYLRKFTDNRQLIDNIAQHFFKGTPTSFALSYFSLYNDYYYPPGGTGKLPRALENYAAEHGAALMPGTRITEVHHKEKYVTDNKGRKYGYGSLIWAADLKTLYAVTDEASFSTKKEKELFLARKNELKDLKGAESVFTVYLMIDLDPGYFRERTAEHSFITPSKEGLSKVGAEGNDKASIKKYLEELVRYNTFEVSIPVLRDSSLAPAGKTAMITSILFEHQLERKIIDQGWHEEFRKYVEALITDQMREIFPEIRSKITGHFSSTPQTIHNMTGSTDGAIVGWAYTNPSIPVTHKFSQVARSVNTSLKNVYKAGQWSYSPAGIPIAILTGKMAAEKALKIA
jgi:phytoene dehydrogenase-like protein